MKNITALIGFLFLLIGTVSAQTTTIRGVVVDAETGEGVPQANVFVVEALKGDAADFDGNFVINDVAYGQYTFRISSIGYVTLEQEILVNEDIESLVFALDPDVASLEDIVVTGVGEIDRLAFTGTASVIAGDKFEKVPVVSFEQALYGKATGVAITSSSGTPGAGKSIRIRGISSINAGVSPLLVIDGVQVIRSGIASSGSTSDLSGIAGLDPNDIASVTVLKDAVSTAPYAGNGSNGVIVITTKSGIAGSTSYSANYSRGTSQKTVDGPRMLTSSETDALYQELYGVSMTETGRWDGSTDTDWDDVVTNDDNVTQNFSLSARGGNASTSFYLSGSYFEQDGIIIGTELDRYSSKFDIKHQFSEKVNIQNSLNMSFVEQDGVLEGGGQFGNPALARNFMTPMKAAYNDDGTPAALPGLHNPVKIQAESIDQKRNARLINSTNINVQIAPNFSLQQRIGIDYLLAKEKYFDDRFYGDGDDDLGRVYDYVNNNSRLTSLTVLKYIYSINSGNTLTATALADIAKNWRYSVLAGGLGLAADGLYNLGSTAEPDFVGGNYFDYMKTRYGVTLNYARDEKLYVDFNAVYEGNSRFDKDNRYNAFFSGGIAYILSNESFFESIDFLDYLRVKFSVGQTGNANVGVNQYQAFVGFGAYNDTPSINIGQLGNNVLTWEKALSYDASVDFELFNRLTGSFTYYRKNSSDLLFNVPLSRTTGHSSQERNIGELFNDGIEIELSGDIIRNRDFNLSLSGNLTTVRNQITDLPVDGNGEVIEITSSLYYSAVEGYAVGSFYTREWAGADPNNGDPLWYVTDDNGNRSTTNNYNSASLYPFKKNADPNIFGSFTANMNYKGLYAFATLYYAFDYMVYDDWAGYQLRDGSLLGTYNYYAKSLERWQQPGDITDVPRLGASSLNSYRTSSRFLYDGDHLRLSELRVGYDIPTEFVESVGLNNVSVYFSGSNLWTHVFDEDLDYDPDAFGPNGQQDLALPPLKTFTFGIQLDF